jgi:hypothetical protein
MVIDQARTRIHDLDRARQIVIMLGAVCHDLGKPPTTAFLDGRIRSIDHEQAGVAPATAVLDRLNIHSIDGYDVRKQILGIVAHHLKPGMFRQSKTAVSDGAFRRLAEKVDLELLALVAKSDCLGRTGNFDCSAGTAGARETWVFSTSRPDRQRPAPAGAWSDPGASRRCSTPADLRKAAGWLDRIDRGRYGARAGDPRRAILIRYY